MEYLQVFDSSKKVIREKVRRDEKDTLPVGRYYMVVLLFIENDKGEFLLQKTSVSRHSCIATTGGHVSYGESPLKTVIKECKEELGIDILDSNIKYVTTFTYKKAYLEVFYMKMNVDLDSLILQVEEVESVNWYSKNQIADFIEQKKIRESNIKPFEKIIEMINNN